MSEESYLAHYGILRRSGRYPWGSGGDQDSLSVARSMLEYVKRLLGMGLTESEVAAGMGIKTTELRDLKTIANAQLRAADVAMATRLREKGMSPAAIAERMGKPKSTVRTLLKPGADDKAQKLDSVTEMLRAKVEETGYLDVGAGTENHIKVSPEFLRAAVTNLRNEGYVTFNTQFDQLGGPAGNKTTTIVLAKEGTTYAQVKANQDKIRQIRDFSEDGGRSWDSIDPPLSISSKRVDIRYSEDGGDLADGVMYVRPGVEDLGLGGKRYAQVRVSVDDTHYLKGMAIYKDDLPDGVDIVFNTNKSANDPKIKDKGKLGALKELSGDEDNPFGAVVRQLKDENGKVKSAFNLVNEEGDWDEWSKTLSSQMLSKQSHLLAKRQLDIDYEIRRDQFDEIMSLTNPAVKRRLLEDFADGADSAAWQLKAHALPRQRTQVILPMNSMKDTEVYAPNFRHGERVALIRFPHGGTFEIPDLVVNNNNPTAKKILGQAQDAIGINAEVAKRLSGADFDGDSVLVIPNNNGLIQSTPTLAGLKNFDPQTAYPQYEGMKVISSSHKERQMGVVSNLITDMTIRGATPNELAAAVRHSMVVIDAEKHKLNYKQSAIDNNIASLVQKYQSPYRENGKGGASTLISRRKQEERVEKRKPRGIDPTTGRKIYADEPDSFVTKDGTRVIKTEKRKKIEILEDTHDLSSGTPVEKVYADYSNSMKALANEARKAAVNTPNVQRSTSAAKVYAKQVASLDAALSLARENAPRERAAQLTANARVEMKKQANPNMDKAEIKKIQSIALKEARARLGVKKQRIKPTPEEWEAIQAGAISNSKLKAILENSDLDEIKKLATPKSTVLMTSSKIQRAKALKATGLTQSEIADLLGVSLSTLKRSVK